MSVIGIMRRRPCISLRVSSLRVSSLRVSSSSRCRLYPGAAGSDALMHGADYPDSSRAAASRSVSMPMRSSVGIQRVAVCVGMRIGPQRPHCPVRIRMSVAGSGAIQTNGTAEPPIVRYDIRQAVITMRQRIVARFAAMPPRRAICRFGAGVPAGPREEGTVRASPRMIPLHCRQVVFRAVRRGASGYPAHAAYAAVVPGRRPNVRDPSGKETRRGRHPADVPSPASRCRHGPDRNAAPRRPVLCHENTASLPPRSAVRRDGPS